MDVARRKVLIVQDDLDMLSHLFRRLCDRFDLITCRSPREGLKRLTSVQDLGALIVQARFSEPAQGSTIPLLKALRRRHPNAPFFITAPKIMTIGERNELERNGRLTIRGVPTAVDDVGEEISKALGLQ